MSQPPRVFESFLKALGADPYLTDVVLGDLAEEYAERQCFDGIDDARRWYVREAIRTVPHLLRSAWSRLRVADVPRLIGVALFAWLALLPIGLTLLVIVSVVLRLIGVDWTIQPTAMNPGFVAFVMLAMPLSGVLGGYVAAWRNSRAPMLGAFAFGLVLTSINLIAGLFAPSPLSVAYRVMALLMFNAGAVIGGAIRATRSPSVAGVSLLDDDH